MKYYELTYLASPDLSAEELNSLSSKISGFIAGQGGSVKEISEPARKKLAYDIKEKKEAFVITSNFYSNSEEIKDLEEKIKKEKVVLRYLIVNKKEGKKISAPKKIIKPATIKLDEETSEKTGLSAPKTEKVELKEIDKKIEEMLKDN